MYLCALGLNIAFNIEGHDTYAFYCAATLECHNGGTDMTFGIPYRHKVSLSLCSLSIGRLGFHNDNEYETDFLGDYIFISCVIPGFTFVIVAVERIHYYLTEE